MVNLDLWRSDRSHPRALWSAWDSIARDFDNFFENFDKGVRGSGTDNTLVPACDIEESEKAFLLSFDMPGFKKEDMNVEVNGNTLSVSAKRERLVNDTKAHRVERQYGEYRRSFTLPENVKGEGIAAAYDNGVLQLTLPKSEMAQKKRIEIGQANEDKRSLDIKDAKAKPLHS